jgi:RNA polymerase sigma factor (sigma-70 family)
MDRSGYMPVTDQTVTAAIAGDEPAFAALTERHRRELHVHCYRMLASFDEAEDAVQETFLKAWRGRSGFDGGSQFRAWLYRIATNVCLDMLRYSSRRTAGTSFAEVPWLQPYPDLLLDQAERRPVPRVQARRDAHRGRDDRRDHHVQCGGVRGVRPGAGAVSALGHRAIACPACSNMSR